jgi:hypothetical protein
VARIPIRVNKYRRIGIRRTQQKSPEETPGLFDYE